MRVLPKQKWRPDKSDGTQPDAEPVGDDLYSLASFEAGENGNGHSNVEYQPEVATSQLLQGDPVHGPRPADTENHRDADAPWSSTDGRPVAPRASYALGALEGRLKEVQG